MNTIKNVMQNAFEQALEILAEMKTTGKNSETREQMEFAFGMVREFEVDPSVRRKASVKF